MSKPDLYDNRLDRRGKPTKASNFETVHLKVPCACAALLKHRGVQAHTVTVVFDGRTASVKTVRAQCDDVEGFGMIADMSPDLPTCVRFAKTLLSCSQHGTDVLHKSSTLLSQSRSIIDVYEFAAQQLERRKKIQGQRKTPDAHSVYTNTKTQLLTKAIHNFVCRSMPVVDDCDPTSCVHAYEYMRLPIFQVEQQTIGDGLVLLYNGGVIAHQDAKASQWIVDESNILATAGHKLHPLLLFNTFKNNVFTYCFYCKKAFERIEKHREGAKHLTNVKNWFSLLLKAHSSAGLKMRNNPKYRHIFFPNVVKLQAELR